MPDLRQPGNECLSPTVHVTLKLGLGWCRLSIGGPTNRRGVCKARSLSWYNFTNLRSLKGL